MFVRALGVPLEGTWRVGGLLGVAGRLSGFNSETEVVSLDTVVVVHSISHVQLFATPWTAAHQASLSKKKIL